MKIAGIIAGLGPETSSEFYLKIIEFCKMKNDVKYPPIIVSSVPVPFSLERDIVEKGRGERGMFHVLVEGIERLEKSKVDFVAIPCNTVHIFIDELRGLFSTPILSIIEETARRCKSSGYRRVGVLATKKTMEKKLYDDELLRFDIGLVKPSPDEVERVSSIIFRILEGNKSEEDRKELLGIINGLRENGAQAVILGCTDLQILVSQEDTSVPLLDTVEIFAEASAEEILGGLKAGYKNRHNLFCE